MRRSADGDGLSSVGPVFGRARPARTHGPKMSTGEGSRSLASQDFDELAIESGFFRCAPCLLIPLPIDFLIVVPLPLSGSAQIVIPSR